MITIEHMTKRYGSLTAVDDLSFTAQSGRVTGFLGPNGAGKTTTLRMATGLIRPNAGQASFNGKHYLALDKPMRHVGLALEPAVFHPGRSALNHLLMLAPYAGVSRERCLEVLGLVGLSDVADKRVGKFSLGMRGRLNLAGALLGDPSILLLDEPVNGLDPEGIRWIRELLRTLANQGRTVLISSHLLSEVQQTVDDLVIIAHGRTVYQGTLEQLEATSGEQVGVVTSDVAGLTALARQLGWQIVASPGASEHPGQLVLAGVTINQIAATMTQAGIPIGGIAPMSNNLESIFLSLTEGQGGMR